MQIVIISPLLQLWNPLTGNSLLSFIRFGIHLFSLMLPATFVATIHLNIRNKLRWNVFYGIGTNSTNFYFNKSTSQLRVNATAVGGSFSALFVIILLTPYSHPLSGHLFNLAAFWCRALQFSPPLSCISYSSYCSSLIVFFLCLAVESMFVNYGIALHREHCVIIRLMNMPEHYLCGHRNFSLDLATHKT